MDHLIETFALDDLRIEGAKVRAGDAQVEQDLVQQEADLANCAPACTGKTPLTLEIRR